jgi:glucose/arabinose dehydrogenase
MKHIYFRYLTPAGALVLAFVVRTAPMAGASIEQAQGQAPPPAGGQAQGAGAAGQQPGGQRGGGRGNPAASLYTEQCSGCHGTDPAGGRAPSLFDDQWLQKTTDDQIVKSIRDGVQGTEMQGFGKALTDQQIWQLIQYLRTQTVTFKPKVEFVADPTGIEIKSEKQNFKIEVLTKDVETPWALAFLPDGRLLITERPGRLRILDKGKLSEPVKGLPAVNAQQDGGLLDVEVHPQYTKTGWIYLSYAEMQPGFTPPPPGAPPAAGAAPGRGRGSLNPAMTVIVRGKISKTNEWTDQQIIFRGPPEMYTPSGAHFGSRFIFDKDGHLFYSIGERGAMENAQNLGSPLGKIHRVNDDGTAPKDNPFVNTPGAVASIWSYGHRNPEGLAWDPVTGKLWESEHGPNNGDEINIIERGHNYGWGVASKGSQGGITKTSEPGMDDPIVYYTPTLAPAGIAFYTGNQYPGWKNTSLFVCGLAGQQLRRLEISGDKVTKQEVVFSQFGRVRDIVQGPDGLFYIALQNPTGIPGVPLSASTPGMVVRLVPVK